MKCKICGADNTYIDPITNLCSNPNCHTKDYWNYRVEQYKSKDPNLVIVDNTAYQISNDEGSAAFKGFGGRRYNILFNDGRKVITNNLWYNGEIPEEFRDRLADNAKFVSDEEIEKITLEARCNYINKLFVLLQVTNSRLDKEALVTEFRKQHPDLNSDLDFCFEVLAGKHKLGYTYIIITASCPEEHLTKLNSYTIEEFYNKVLKAVDATDDGIRTAARLTPDNVRNFFYNLANREFRLGYSNRNAMITNLSPMLAKKYPDTFESKAYYIQEKLDGNRCIAYYDSSDNCWKFQSRSGKPLKVNFDMTWVDAWLDEQDFYCREYPIFDGEIMTLEHAGSRDFNRTSGAINGKYTDKSGLHYFIYDIIAPKLKYIERKDILDSITYTGPDCQILPVLDKVELYPNPAYNTALDVWLDKITEKGGEGLILRDPDGYYQCGKRSNGLLKYKKVQTMDLRIIDFNFGNGKYENAIGSFVCETDDHKIQLNVSGMPDDIHYDDPANWMGRIIEVAYFDICKSKDNTYSSLRFPRLKRVRDDKNTTSIY